MASLVSLAPAGEPRRISFARYPLKPLQALAFVEGGGPQELGFSREQVAMMCSSHTDEPMHVAQIFMH